MKLGCWVCAVFSLATLVVFLMFWSPRLQPIELEEPVPSDGSETVLNFAANNGIDTLVVCVDLRSSYGLISEELVAGLPWSAHYAVFDRGPRGKVNRQPFMEFSAKPENLREAPVFEDEWAVLQNRGVEDVYRWELIPATVHVIGEREVAQVRIQWSDGFKERCGELGLEPVVVVWADSM